MTIKYVSIGMIIAILLTSTIALATPVKAGDRDCNRYPDDPLCTGEKGAAGMTFCDLAWSDPDDVDRFGDCYDRDFSTIDCDEHAGHSRCTGYDGRDGLIFCDVQYEDVGYNENCYDRNDNPSEYCNEYARDESDRWYAAEFCGIVCSNYQDVVINGQDCADHRDRNNDDTISNDIPPDGEGLFCDHPSNPGSCYDRNDNSEEFCVNNPQYTKFCEVIGEICDDEDSIASTDPECTGEDEPCPQNYIRYNEYCAQHRVDCEENPSNVYCSGQRRSDGLQRCDEPGHPGYRFCN